MHYLLQQANKFYFSSWLNKAYLGILVLLSSFILISIIWHTYDTVRVVKLTSAQESVTVKDAKRAVVRKANQPSVNLFGSHQKSPERVNRSLDLLGVIESGNFRNSRAIIASPNGDGEMYSVGEEISPNLTLHRVFADRVILNRNGVLEILYLDWGEGITQSVNTVEQGVATPYKQNYKRDYSKALRSFGSSYGDFGNIGEKIRQLQESGELEGLRGLDMEEIRERLKNQPGY